MKIFIQSNPSIALFSFILLLGCNYSNKKEKSYRDTVIEKYFSMVDSSGRYDTTDSHFKALKAYYYNDTTLLKKLDSTITDKKHNRPNWELWVSDIPLPPLKQLQANAAYRFIFSIYDGPTFEAITIRNMDTAIMLHYLFYKNYRDNATIKKFKEFERPIPKEQWDTMEEKLRDADFWGLKNGLEYRGNDGNDITVIGYYRSEDFEKSNYVHRWRHTELTNAFYYVYWSVLQKNERQFKSE